MSPIRTQRRKWPPPAACRQLQVPVTLYRYASGGHGFALGRAGTPSVEWPERYAAWLAAR